MPFGPNVRCLVYDVVLLLSIFAPVLNHISSNLSLISHTTSSGRTSPTAALAHTCTGYSVSNISFMVLSHITLLNPISREASPSISCASTPGLVDSTYGVDRSISFFTLKFH